MSRFLSLPHSHHFKSPSGQAADRVNPSLYTSSTTTRADSALQLISNFQNLAFFSALPGTGKITLKLCTESFEADKQIPEPGPSEKKSKKPKKTFDRIFQSIISATETKTL